MNNDRYDGMTEPQIEALKETLKRGSEFEVMMQSAGWKLIESYVASKIQIFANDIILQDDKDISEFEKERREIIGIRKLLNIISGDVETLKNERKRETATTPTE